VVLPDNVDDPADELAWLAFEGRCGERQNGPFDGPTGPVAKERWLEPLTGTMSCGPGDEADVAIEFAVALSDAIEAHAHEVETPLGVHIGVSSGPVATGMIERGHLTFAAWGEPIRRALVIGALA
jgi:class 3 adenylate cyclase